MTTSSRIPAELTSHSPRQPAGEEPALRVRRGRPQGVLERRPRLVPAPQAAQQLGPSRMQISVIPELERVDELERALGRARHGDRRRAVQRHPRRAGQPLEPLVERRDLVPVDLILSLERGDCCLEHVRACRRPQGQRSRECGLARLDLRPVVAGAVLLGQGDQLTVDHPCLAA